MIELDLCGTRDVDELRDLRIGHRGRLLVSGVLRSTGIGRTAENDQAAQETCLTKPARASHLRLPWVGAGGGYLLSSSVDIPAGWSCISLKTASSFSFMSLYLLYSSTSRCESAVRPNSR